MARFAYWTIIVAGGPTAFRSANRDDLVPTLKQLQRANPDAELKWFQSGRLWDSQESARETLRREQAQSLRPRGRDWRPGGEHRDPRERFKLPRDVRRRRMAQREGWRRDDDVPPGAPVLRGRPPGKPATGGKGTIGRTGPPGRDSRWGRGPTDRPTKSGPPKVGATRKGPPGERAPSWRGPGARGRGPESSGRSPGVGERGPGGGGGSRAPTGGRRGPSGGGSRGPGGGAHGPGGGGRGPGGGGRGPGGGARGPGRGGRGQSGGGRGPGSGGRGGRR
jgi:hypothetical protein